MGESGGASLSMLSHLPRVPVPCALRRCLPHPAVETSRVEANAPPPSALISQVIMAASRCGEQLGARPRSRRLFVQTEVNQGSGSERGAVTQS
ncbi:hypothetical protein AAFF_G00008510 [Aldrovandia affinis]|uniref:Uncharacterized protein n=1 Tax=Aldrovandia affinis TaxID=143900 RepID=A0AAD7WZZ6_9TELE|nr:hypothetical protein AAFF_G00008510 [Aldrovandia affinis]